MKTNALFMGGLKFLSAPFDMAARFAEPIRSASTTSLAATEAFIQRVPEFFSGLTIPTASALPNWKTVVLIPSALLHSAMVTMNLLPMRPANPFAEQRNITSTTIDVEEATEEVLPENSFFIEPIGYKRKNDPAQDPFTNIRFNDRF